MATGTRTTKKTKKTAVTKKTAKKKAEVKKQKSKSSTVKKVPNKRPVRKKFGQDPSRILGIPISLSLAVLSPTRLPLDYEKIMIQTARFAGWFFVATGVFFTALHLPGASQHISSTTETQSLLALVSETDRTLDTTLNTDGIVLSETTDNSTADTTNTKESTDSSHAETDTSVNDGTVDSTAATDHEETTDSNSGSGTVDKTPEVSIKVSQGETEIYARFEVDFADSIDVKLVLPDGSVESLGNADKELSGIWSFSHSKTDLKSENYTIFALVTNQYGQYKTDRVNIAIEKSSLALETDISVTDSDADGVLDSTDELLSDGSILHDETTDIVESETTTGEVESLDTDVFENKVTVDVDGGDTVSDRVLIRARSKGAESVGFYIESEFSTSPTFLGLAKLNHGDWLYEWNTLNQKDGRYRLLAVAKGDAQRALSEPLTISVSNSQTETESVVDSAQTETIKTVSQEDTSLLTKDTESNDLKDVTNGIEEDQMDRADQFSSVTEPKVDASELNDEDTVLVARELDSVMIKYKNDLDTEIKSFTRAIRSADELQVEYSRKRLDDLKSFMLNDYQSDTDRDFSRYVEEKLSEELKVVEEKIKKTEEIAKNRTGEAISVDTDNDGITDFDEINIYKTNPESADSDGDGISDSDELLQGFNPVEAAGETPVEFESPKVKGIVREDLFVVESIEKVLEPVSATSTEPKIPDTALIKGKGLPNSFVKLYVYSTPTIITVKTGADGTWSYRFDKELEDGEHEVYVGVTDNAGKIVAKSEPLRFVKTAEAFTPVASADSAPPTEAVTVTTESPVFLTDSVVGFILSVSLILIGVLLLLLGLFLHGRRQERVLTANYLPNATT